MTVPEYADIVDGRSPRAKNQSQVVRLVAWLEIDGQFQLGSNWLPASSAFLFPIFPQKPVAKRCSGFGEGSKAVGVSLRAKAFRHRWAFFSFWSMAGRTNLRSFAWPLCEGLRSGKCG